MSVSVFDKIGVVAARPPAAGSIVALAGVGDAKATFGLLQGFSIDSKVLAQIKRTLRHTPVIFPMGDDLSEISLNFMAPLSSPCGDVVTSDLGAAFAAYAANRVTPTRVAPVNVTVSGKAWSCLMLGLRADGAVQGGAQTISVALRLVGVSVGQG